MSFTSKILVFVAHAFDDVNDRYAVLVFTAHPAPKCRKHRWGPGFLRLAVRLGFYGASWPQVPKTPAWPMFSAHAVSTVFCGTSSIFGVNPVARCTKRRPHWSYK